MSSADIFRQHGAIHLARIVPQDVCKFMTHILMLKGAYGVGDDDQVPGSLGVGHGEMACETLLDSLLGKHLNPFPRCQCRRRDNRA
jgi:hypothetical protein